MVEEEEKEKEEVDEEKEEKDVEEDNEDSVFGIKIQEKPYSPLDGHKYSVNHVEFSPCGTMLASCSLDGTAVVWDTEVDMLVVSAFFFLFHCLPFFSTTCFDAQNGCQARSSFLNSRSSIRVCRWSPDGTKIATAGDDESTTLWDVNSMEELWYVFLWKQSCVRASDTYPTKKKRHRPTFRRYYSMFFFLSRRRRNVATRFACAFAGLVETFNCRKKMLLRRV